MTDSQICDNVLLMLFAGHDTSSSTLTHCLNNLQDHPAAMQQLRAEQAAVVAKHGEHITAAALKDMHYAEAVIRCGDVVQAGLIVRSSLIWRTRMFDTASYGKYLRLAKQPPLAAVKQSARQRLPAGAAGGSCSCSLVYRSRLIYRYGAALCW